MSADVGEHLWVSGTFLQLYSQEVFLTFYSQDKFYSRPRHRLIIPVLKKKKRPLKLSLFPVSKVQRVKTSLGVVNLSIRSSFAALWLFV